MITNTKYSQKILDALRPLDVAYTKHFTPEQARLYHQVLTNLHVDVEKLRLAVTVLITSLTFLPSIAEILETIHSWDDTTMDPYTAWSHVLEAASGIGFDKGLSVLTPLEARAAKVVGWHEICYGSLSDTSLRRAHFFKVFESFINRERRESQRTRLLAASDSMTKSLNAKIDAIAASKSF